MALNQTIAEVSQFELSKTIYFSEVFKTLRTKKEIKLTLTSKSVLIAISNHYPNIFPSMEYIADKLDISVRSVQRAVKELTNAGLIIYETKRNNYYKFTPYFFELLNLSGKKRQNDMPDTTNCPTNKKIIKNNKKISSCETLPTNNKLNDDVNLLKNSFKETETKSPDKKSTKTQYTESEKQRYKTIIEQLESWHFTGGKFVIKRYGLDKIENLIKFVKQQKSNNPGAYLRSLLNIPDFKPIFKEEYEQETRINKLKELLNDNKNYLNDKVLAEIQLKSYDYHKKLNDHELLHIISLIEQWNFSNYHEFRVLSLLDSIKSDPENSHKYNDFRQQIISLGIKYQEQEINALNEAQNEQCINKPVDAYKSPFTDKDTAINFINSFSPKELQSHIIQKQVRRIREIWNL